MRGRQGRDLRQLSWLRNKNVQRRGRGDYLFEFEVGGGEKFAKFCFSSFATSKDGQHKEIQPFAKSEVRCLRNEVFENNKAGARLPCLSPLAQKRQGIRITPVVNDPTHNLYVFADRHLLEEVPSDALA